jgi:hypothetical protein
MITANDKRKRHLDSALCRLKRARFKEEEVRMHSSTPDLLPADGKALVNGGCTTMCVCVCVCERAECCIADAGLVLAVTKAFF